MITDVNQNLKSITLGIRFRANFAIEDQLGKIIDQILYADDAYFNSKIFPLVKGEVGRKILYNTVTQDKLIIDNSNIVIELLFNGSFKVDDLRVIHRKFEDQIINGVLKQFNIREIVRLGYVKTYVFPIENLARNFVDKTVGKTMDSINDINLRFSKKIPIEEALVKKDVNDYYNAIFNIIKKADLQELYVAVDFQQYFDPFLRDASEANYTSFITSAEKFNNTRYLTWLNTNYIEESR